MLLMDSGICESCLFLKCEGEGGRDRGKGQRPANSPPRTSGKSYTNRLHMCMKVNGGSVALEPGGLGQFPSSNIVGCVSVK